MEALDQAVVLWVVGSGGDVFEADGLTQGLPDVAAELRASVRSDGCRSE